MVRKTLGACALTAGLLLSMTACTSTPSTAESTSPQPVVTTNDSTSTPSAPSTQTAPTNSSNWYVEKYGTFSPITKSGSGAAEISLPDNVTTGLIYVTHDDEGMFQLMGADSKGQSLPSVSITTDGKYSGSTAFGVSALSKATKLTIASFGSWTLSIEPLSAAKPLPKSGKTSGVYKYDGGAGEWKITHKGDGNFSVIQYSTAMMPNPAANVIGAFNDTVKKDAGPSIVIIDVLERSGEWTIE